MRYLGIDYGTKWIGTALSDDEGRMAFPHTIFENDTHLITSVKKICEEENIGAVVIGESRDYKQKENPIMKGIKIFADTLQKELGLPVYYEPEFLTSQEARRIQGEGGDTHSSAAALILQSYIDKIKH